RDAAVHLDGEGDGDAAIAGIAEVVGIVGGQYLAGNLFLIPAAFVRAIALPAGTSASAAAERRAGPATAAGRRGIGPDGNHRSDRRRRMRGPRPRRTAQWLRLGPRRRGGAMLGLTRRDGGWGRWRWRSPRQRDLDQPLDDVGRARDRYS